jgi:hypothetical protein
VMKRIPNLSLQGSNNIGSIQIMGSLNKYNYNPLMNCKCSAWDLFFVWYTANWSTN